MVLAVLTFAFQPLDFAIKAIPEFLALPFPAGNFNVERDHIVDFQTLPRDVIERFAAFNNVHALAKCERDTGVGLEDRQLSW